MRIDPGLRSLAATLILLAAGPLQSAELSLSTGAVFQECDDCPEMVIVPPGRFTMGFDGGLNEERYEGPVREVTIDYAFALGRYEVTQAQYATFVEATGHVSGTGCAIWDGETWNHMDGKDWRDPGYGRPPALQEPVACVTWYDVKAYVDWIAAVTGQPYRLPSEAEWEYASRAGLTGPYTWGDDPNGGCRFANHYDQSGATKPRPYDAVECDDGFVEVAPVGSLEPNGFGLYDMTGNVWEWVQDCYRMPIPAEPTDGSPLEVEGECDRRAVKGGAWSSSLFWQRPTFRGRDPLDRISHIFGVRIARDLKAGE